MRRILSLFSLLALCTVAVCSKHYIIQGHLPGATNEKQLNFKQLQDLINNEISTLFPNENPILSDMREKQHLVKSSNLPFELQLTMESEITDRIFQTERIRLTSYSEVAFAKVKPDNQTQPDCFNEGYLGADGTCVCPEKFSGPRCQNLDCNNGGIPDFAQAAPQCYCAPGYNDFFCLNRACRPAVQDDINPPTKNLYVVMPATNSFDPYRQRILDSYESLLGSLTIPDEQWIGQFIGVNFYTSNGETVTNLFMTQNQTDFIARMRTLNGWKVDPRMDEGDQSLLEAIALGLFDPLNGYVSGYPIVFAYSNAAERPEAYLDESYALQPLLWRAKVFVNVVTNFTASTINTSSKDFKKYYDFSEAAHSPFLFYDTSEIETVHASIWSNLYKPQYVDVRSQIKSTLGLVQANRDYGDISQVIRVLVTSNQPVDAGQLIIKEAYGNQTLQADNSGPYWAVYTLPSSWFEYAYVAAPNLTYSLYTWVSSQETALWAGHEDPHTDIGGVISNAESGYHFAVAPIAIKWPVLGINYKTMDSGDLEPIYSAMYLTQRPGCTLDYQFEKIPHCNQGPFIHQVTLVTEYGTVTRVFPGFCVHTLVLQEPELQRKDKEITFRIPVGTTQMPPSTPAPVMCSAEGTAVFADDRNHPFREFIFAVEWSDNDHGFILDVEGDIPALLDSVYDVYMQQRFTFIVFNKNVVKTVVSQTRRDLFEQRVYNLVDDEITAMLKGQMNDTEKHADSIDSVIMANLQTLNPKGQAFVFTNTLGKGTQPALNKVFPKSFQVNYFYHTTVFDTYPFSLLTRQTNGRWISAKYPGDIVDGFLPETTKSDLIFDEVYQAPPGMPFKYAFMVEESATMIEVLLNGAFQNFAVSDSNGTQLIYNATYDGNVAMIVADVSKRGTEQYTLTADCTYCTIQIRVASPLRVILGFTANEYEDTNYQTQPSAWLRLDDYHHDPSFIAARVTGLGKNEHITNFTITSSIGSYSGPSFTANTQSFNNYMNTQMFLRNSSQCSYQWIGSVRSFYEQAYWERDLEGLKLLITIQTDKGMQYTRMVYYYLPKEMTEASICQNGGKVDPWGACNCTENFTGDFCDTPVCLNRGVQNFGACNCQSRFVGRFCETEITEQWFNNGTTAAPPTTVNTQPSSTPGATTKFGSSQPSVTSSKQATLPVQTPTVVPTISQAPVSSPASTASPAPVSTGPGVATISIASSSTVPNTTGSSSSRTVTKARPPATTTHNSGSSIQLVITSFFVSFLVMFL